MQKARARLRARLKVSSAAEPAHAFAAANDAVAYDPDCEPADASAETPLEAPGNDNAAHLPVAAPPIDEPPFDIPETDYAFGAPDLDEDEAPPLGDDPAPMLDAEDELELLVEAEPDAPADDAPLLLETEAEPEPPAEDAALSAEPESPPDEAPLLLDAEADAAKHDDAALVEEDPPFDPPDEQDEAFGPPHLLTEIAPAEDELLLTPAPQPKSAGRTLPGGAAPRERYSERPAPPISVFAAWDRDDMAKLLTGFAADRRMAAAEVEIERGGLDAVIARLGQPCPPDLIVLDTNLGGAELLRGLDRLACAISPGVELIILGAVNDVALLRELAARGVRQYMVPPVRESDLVRLVCGLYADADKSRTIAVIGARGGVGASTIAHNLAWSIAERHGARAALLDLDLPFGAAGFHLGEAPGTIAEALDAEAPDAALIAGIAAHPSERLALLTAPASLARTFDLDPEPLQTLIAVARRTRPFVVLDLPHMWAPWVKQALRAADDVVLVASPDLASLRNADNIVKLLKSERPDAPPLVVLSMTGVPKRPEIPFKDFVQALGLKPEASFAFDPVLFGAAAMTGQALGEIAPRSKPAAAIDLLASALTGREPLATKPASAAAAPPPLADLIRAAAGGDLAAPAEPAAEAAPLVLSEALPVAPAANENEVAELEADTAAVEAEPITEGAEAAIEAELAPELEADTAAVEAEPIAESAEAAAEGEPEPAELRAEPAASALALVDEPRRRRGVRGLVRAIICFVLLGAAAGWYLANRPAPAPQARATISPAPAPAPAASYEDALALLESGRHDQAEPVLRRLAEAGHARAQYRLAKLYERGARLALARRWSERAAEAGNVAAMHDLGVYYARGEAAPKDDAAAFRWFRQAADFGMADSQFNLGVIYEHGRGVAADANEALFWFSLAAAQGDSEAGERAAALAAQLTPMQIEQAQVRAGAFTARTPDPAAND